MKTFEAAKAEFLKSLNGDPNFKYFNEGKFIIDWSGEILKVILPGEWLRLLWENINENKEGPQSMEHKLNYAKGFAGEAAANFFLNGEAIFPYDIKINDPDDYDIEYKGKRINVKSSTKPYEWLENPYKRVKDFYVSNRLIQAPEKMNNIDYFLFTHLLTESTKITTPDWFSDGWDRTVWIDCVCEASMFRSICYPKPNSGDMVFIGRENVTSLRFGWDPDDVVITESILAEHLKDIVKYMKSKGHYSGYNGDLRDTDNIQQMISTAVKLIA